VKPQEFSVAPHFSVTNIRNALYAGLDYIKAGETKKARELFAPYKNHLLVWLKEGDPDRITVLRVLGEKA
jgi:hypothetical protein